MKIICTGDLHLGRRPTRLPEAVADDPRIAVASVWDSTVEQATARRVDAVVLTGDLIDRENRFFEAWGPLERGLRRLSAANIPTVIVAGNHDYDVLPQLVLSLDLERVHLLGADGQWQLMTLDTADAPLHIFGWSFPRQHVDDSPMVNFPPSADPGHGVRVGVLHADLDQPDSRYGPVRLDELTNKPIDAWLLGHVHAPMWRAPVAGSPGVLYPGSPQPLSPREPDVHGPWLLELQPGQPAQAAPLALATVRYESIAIAVNEHTDLQHVQADVPVRIAEALQHPEPISPSLVHVSCRIALTGSTRLHGRLSELAESLHQLVDLPLGQATVSVEKVTVDTRPALDLTALSASTDAVGELARLIVALDRGEDLDPQLIQSARSGSANISAAPAYRSLYATEEDGPHAAHGDGVDDRLRRQALALIARLVEDKEGRP